VSHPRGAERTDGDLLACFVSRREQAALDALVRRHGAMVWGVCRRILSHHHDAEDAFQATFLVLVRKAHSVVPREMVANWLYGVARQTALKARTTAAKRRLRETQVAEMPEPETRPQDPLNELQPLLDAEVSRLPDKYRVVLVLCELEGKSRKETAGQLRLAEGTVASRLARAKSMLAKRMARHGPALSGSAVSAALARDATASVPDPVLSSTIEAASVYAAGQTTAGLILPPVAALTEGVMRSMMMTRLKTIVLISVMALPLCGLTGAAVSLGRTEQEPGKTREPTPLPEKKEAAKPAQEAKTADDVTDLRKARLDLAQKGYDVAVERIGLTKRMGNTLVYVGKPEEVYTWSVRLLQTEREMKPKRADQLAALEAHLKRMIQLQKAVKDLSRDLLPPGENLSAEWHRLEADLWLAQAKAK
jgi:RNA polymerase sigma factor (sigma-70 family)